MNDFIMDDFYNLMRKYDLNVYGLLDSRCKIHTLGTDSKIIGRIFEIFTQPILEAISKKHGLILKTPDSQTLYPDFILMKDETSKDKIAIDVKTTYIDSKSDCMKFTLGSYGSYMRNNTKNIEYRYTDYIKHYVIGYVYQRNGMAQESRVFEFENRSQIQAPYLNIRFFIQEKYKIAGDKPGSGNTENIGSISTSRFDDFVEGRGPFSSLGVDVYNIYWKYYPKYRVSSEDDYHSLNEFKIWIKKHKNDVQLLKDQSFEKISSLIK